MKKIIVILTIILTLPFMAGTGVGLAYADISTYHSAGEPVVQWQSTSSMLRPTRDAARVSYTQPAQYRNKQSATPVMNWKPLYATTNRKKGIVRGGISNQSGSFSALAISRDNYDNRSQESSVNNDFGPRRVGPGPGGGLPPDPFYPPVGDTPWLIMVLLGICYITFVTYKRKKDQA